MDIDISCSKHFLFRDLIECGETFHCSDIENLPIQEESWQALSDLASNTLDPVHEKYGSLNLTFGFCSAELAKCRQRLAKRKNALPAIYPCADQHASYELNNRGEHICARRGAACDFSVPGTLSLEVALWIAGTLPFDRIYFYAPDRPIHVSYSATSSAREVTVMKPKTSGRGFVPGTMTAEKFLERYADES